MISEISSVLMVCGAIVAIVGACRIYYKWSNGHEEMEREVMVWAGGILLLVLVQAFIKIAF